MSRATVIGLGNVLVGDDAFGPFAARMFGALYDVDPDVSVLDLGTPGLDLAPYLEGVDTLIVLDTVSADAPPGSIRSYTKDQLLAKPAISRTNPHQPGVKDTLLMLELEGESPDEVVLVGVVPERVETGVGMSETLRAAVPEALRVVADVLARRGHAAEERAVARDPDIWWERRRRAAVAR